MLHTVHRLAVIKCAGTMWCSYPKQAGAKPLGKWQKEERKPRKPHERPEHAEKTGRQGTAIPAEAGDPDQTTEDQNPDPGGSLAYQVAREEIRTSRIANKGKAVSSVIIRELTQEEEEATQALDLTSVGTAGGRTR